VRSGYVVVAMVLVTASSLWLSPVRAQVLRTDPSNESIASTVRSHGLAITLSVPKRAYPEGSLVPTTITVRNISHRPLGVLNSKCDPGIETEVLNGAGDILYPPAFRGQFEPNCLGRGPVCPNSPGLCLKPGKVLRISSIVVLLGARIRAEVTRATRYALSPLLGKPLTIRLTPSRAERVRMIPTSNNTFVARIYPVPAHAGRLYYASALTCYTGEGISSGGDPPGDWASTTAKTLRASFKMCHKGYVWQFVAGWIGHPAVEVRM